MATLKELTLNPDTLSAGHRLCPGCGASVIVNQIGRVTDAPLVVGCATGCLEVASTIYPYTAWNTPFIHSAFENSAATMSGLESAFRAMKAKGKIPADKEFRFVAFGGDGGTYDIGFQSLSGAMERGHNMTYVCYDNGAYMNTGTQRSSATPYGAATSTTPVAPGLPGKREFRKDLAAVMAAHNIPYVAQASLARWKDLATKAEKAFKTDGPSFLNVLSPCPRGWRTEAKDSIALSKLALETCYWPIFEVTDGIWKVNYQPGDKKKPIVDFLKPQGRFKHLFAPENEHVLEEIQANIDKEWDKLLWRTTYAQDATA